MVLRGHYHRSHSHSSMLGTGTRGTLACDPPAVAGFLFLMFYLLRTFNIDPKADHTYS